MIIIRMKPLLSKKLCLLVSDNGGIHNKPLNPHYNYYQPNKYLRLFGAPTSSSNKLCAVLYAARFGLFEVPDLPWVAFLIMTLVRQDESVFQATFADTFSDDMSQRSPPLENSNPISNSWRCPIPELRQTMYAARISVAWIYAFLQVAGVREPRRDPKSKLKLT